MGQSVTSAVVTEQRGPGQGCVMTTQQLKGPLEVCGHVSRAPAANMLVCDCLAECSYRRTGIDGGELH